MKKYSTHDIHATLADPKAKELFDLMNREYAHIHKIGYRSMPEDMYLDGWYLSKQKGRSMKIRG